MKIEKIYINNFRSLVDFRVDDFDKTTIFYGENNAGKSNILKALELIFKRKLQYLGGGDYTAPINFYEGILENFSNNYFGNNEELIINFHVVLTILESDTVIKDSISNLFKVWPEVLSFSINGSIAKNYLEDNLAEIKTNKIEVNNVLIYEANLGVIKYFPTLPQDRTQTIGDYSEALAHFVNPLNDCIYVIGSSRNTKPTIFNNELLEIFSPTDFKKSLYSLYLNEKTYHIFEEINNVFNNEPFSFGSISFANVNKELELMIKNESVRLPIKHLGSGVEQILFIISSLIITNSKIICIEELEQNLSPKLQNLALRKIQSLIGKTFDQLIISSHSGVFAKQKLSNCIYLIKKEGLKTKVTEKLNIKFGKEIKEHFIDAALPFDTYTEEELKQRTKEINKMTEELFNR